MKAYILSLFAGLLVGLFYNLAHMDRRRSGSN
jgi:XapX domain-containing protein